VFETGEVGVVVTHRPPLIFVYTDKDAIEVTDGKATILENLASIDVPEGVRITDCFGRPLEGPIVEDSSEYLKRPIFSPIPKVKDIALIDKPLLTGITMFDALAPIGKGQNMLFVGHDIEDMRRYVCDMLSIQSKTTKCVYAATSNQEDVKRMLAEAKVLDDIVLVSGADDETNAIASAAEATVTAATACSIAEAFATEKGMDTLVVIDSLNQHKDLWDATTRVLVDVFGIDSVVKADRDGGASSEMRAFFSTLVQRSAQYKKKYGGGSVTLLLLHTIPKISDGENAVFGPEDFEGSSEKVKERIDLLVQRKIPLTADNLRKIQIPIPSDLEAANLFALQHIDELISMTDGQIWLDEKIERAGRNPSMDFQRSVTRIGIGADTNSRADAPAIHHVVEGLRLALSQALSMDGADVETSASKKQMRAASAWLLAMHQPSASGARKLSESCIVLLAAAKGHLDDSVDSGINAGTPEGTKLVQQLVDHVSSVAPAAMEEIDSSEDISDGTKGVVEDAIKSYFNKM
jgi:F0F1-type ATP synthase alpha subunit